MRFLLALLLLAPLAAAQAEREVAPLFGKDWGKMPAWQQQDILERYDRFLRMPEEKRRAIRERGLKEFLMAGKRLRLPQPLNDEIRKLPRGVQQLAGKLAVLRLRHIRFDRHLSLVPFAERRRLFRNLFPEPFRRGVAHRARRDLNKYVSRAMIAHIKPLVARKQQELSRPLNDEEKKQLVRRVIADAERKVVEQVRKELLIFRSRDADRIRKTLEKRGYPLLERSRVMATPRQRELIRYALRPEQCPLIDPERLAGPRPVDPAGRKLWERDFRVLARIDLLTEARFPADMVLHLAASNSAGELLRGLQAFRPRPGPKKPLAIGD